MKKNQKIRIAYEFIQKGRIDLALEEIKDIVQNINNRDLLNDYYIQSSSFYRLKDEKTKGINNDYELQENKITLSVLNILQQIEDNIETATENNDYDDTSSLSLSIQEIKTLIDDFKLKSDTLYKPTKKELSEIYDLKVKLYDLIFFQFDEKLTTIPNIKMKSINILFERIISNDILTQIDKQAITLIIKKNDFEWYEKVLIISALLIGLQNKFDKDKVHLLLDFLSFFEDKVWECALISLLIGLHKYENKILIHSNIVKRFNELKGVESIQVAMHSISSIVSKGLYKFRFLSFEDIANQNIFSNVISNVFAMKDELINQVDVSNIFPNISNSLFYDLLNRLDLGEKKNTNDDKVFYSFPKHYWFLPFFNNNYVLNKGLESLNVNIDPVRFKSLIRDTLILSDSQKYYLMLNIHKYTKDSFEKLLLILLNERILFTQFEEEHSKNCTKNTIDETSNTIDKEIIFRFLRNYSEYIHFNPEVKKLDGFNLMLENSPLYKISQQEDNIIQSSELTKKLDETNTQLSLDNLFNGILQGNKDEGTGLEKFINIELLDKIPSFLNMFDDSALKSMIEIIDSSDKQIDINKYFSENFADKFTSFLQISPTELKSNTLIPKVLGLLKNNKYQKIIELENDIMHNSSNNIPLLYSLGFSFYRMKKFEKSLYYFEKSIESAPSHSIFYSNSAYCYLALNKFPQARKRLIKALEVDSGDSLALKNMGLLNLCEGNLEKAESYMIRAIKSVNEYDYLIEIIESDKEFALENKDYNIDFLDKLILKFKKMHPPLCLCLLVTDTIFFIFS